MKSLFNLFFIMLALIAFNSDAVADATFSVPDYATLPVAPNSILDKINNDYSKLVPKWGNSIQAYAVKLFWYLVLVDFTWTTIVWVKDRKEIGEILMSYVSKIMSIGFFYLMLQFAGNWIPAIISSFAKIGQDASGMGGVALTPDGIFAMSLTVVFDMYGAMSDLSVTDRIAVSFGVAFAAVFIIVGFAMIAGQLLVTLVESYIAIGGGVILLGFGGSRWTTDMASSYLKFAVGTGIKLMLCYLVIGAGFTMFTMHFPPVDAAANGVVKIYIVQSLTIAGEALIFVYLTFNIPGLASSMVSGSPNMSLGGLAGASITAAAGVAGAGAATQAFGGAKVASAAGEAIKGSLPGNGQMQAANMNLLNGGSGGNGVQSPGSGLGITPNMPGAAKTGRLANDLAKGSASSASTDAGASSSAPLSTPRAGASPSASSSYDAAASANTSYTSSAAPDTGSGNKEQGDVSQASIGGGVGESKLMASIAANMEKMANGGQSQKLSDKISSMQKFVPNDTATVQTHGISMGHTRD